MLKKLALLVVLACLTISAQAQVNIFTEHQMVYMVQHGVNQDQDVQFKTGNYPYLGRIGLEYERNKWSYQLAYIHRSNADLVNQDEYNYNGVALGVKYTHCVMSCK